LPLSPGLWLRDRRVQQDAKQAEGSSGCHDNGSGSHFHKTTCL
jgi:hypothetical protein